MKFGRYLEETQTPEWKKAYIDYRGLKKQIGVIEEVRAQPVFENDDRSERPRSRSATPPPFSPQKVTFEEPQEMALRRMSIKSNHRTSMSITGARGGMNRMSRILNLVTPLVGNRSRPTSFVDSIMGRPAEPFATLPLHEILTLLSPQELLFFTMLDQQLEKVEKFYIVREEQMLTRGRLLQMQLNELNEHRNQVHNKLPLFRLKNNKGAPKSLGSTTSPTVDSPIPPFVYFSQHDSIPSVALSPNPSIHGKSRGRSRDRVTSVRSFPRMNTPTDTISNASMRDTNFKVDYTTARKRLKKAALEFYKGLELLQNYCIMNQTGFRKAVKKFEKVTNIPVQNLYMREKVEISPFFSYEPVKDMKKQIEDMYAVAFLEGDNKKAASRLRGVTGIETQHLSTFRTGLYLGLAVPALIEGLRKASQQETRDKLQSWEVLLYLYGTLCLPLVFALLVGINLTAWASARINYVFIFELDVLSRIDHRRYFELPAFLLVTLVYGFYLSFDNVAPQIHLPILWPLIWFFFAIVVIINPLPVMHRGSRYWLIRYLGKQILSGTRPVSFTDFWIGDQLCSLTFSLSHFATFVCAYVHHFQGSFPVDLNQTCGTVTNMWGIELALLCVPNIFRFLQSVRRYADSSLNIHLLNAGKYAAGIVYSCLYLKWREVGERSGPVFALWCVCGVFYSVYGIAWDLIMDWSLLNIRGAKYPLLRPELLYRDNIFVYYVAMVANILGRFSWLYFIPTAGPGMLARTFYVALFETCRRCLWNFFRLENEHLGNVDQYRVTREVPLPYSVEIIRDDDDFDRDLRGSFKS